MNDQERAQIDRAHESVNPESAIEWCQNGCGLTVQYCMCDVMDEVAEMLKTKTVKRDNRTVNDYGGDNS